MVFKLLFSSPYPWFFLASFFLGGALSKLSRNPQRAKNPEKAKEKKFFWTVCGFSLFFLTFLAGLFIPGFEKSADYFLFIFMFILTLVFFLFFRFKKAFGIPVLFLALLSLSSFFLFLQAITVFTGETEIAKIKVISVSDNKINFELIDKSGIVTTLEMPGIYLGAEVKEIIFHDFFVFLGAKTAYRFIGLKSAGKKEGSEMTQELKAFELPRPQGISESLFQFVSNNLDLFPFIKTAQIQITYLAVKSGATYSIRVQHDSGVEIMRTFVLTE